MYATKKSLNKHVRLNHSRSAFKYCCSKCGSECKQAHTLKEHYHEVHNVYVSIDLAKRKKEPVTGVRQNNVRIKQRFQNKIVPRVTCETSCTNKSNLRRHMIRHMASKQSVMDTAEPKTPKDKISKRPRYIISNTKSIASCSTRTTRSSTKLNADNTVDQENITKQTVLNVSTSKHTTTRPPIQFSNTNIVTSSQLKCINSVDPSFDMYQSNLSETQHPQENLLEVKSQSDSLILHQSQANEDEYDEDEIPYQDSDSYSERSYSDDDDDEEEKSHNNSPEVNNLYGRFQFK